MDNKSTENTGERVADSCCQVGDYDGALLEVIENCSNKVKETTSVGVSPQLSPPPPSTVGSPLFWIGIGVGFSALFSVVASRVKKYAMQQAFKSMMGQMNTQNNPFDSGAFSSGPPFPFPMPSASGPATPAGFAGNQSQATSTRSTSQSTVTVDIPATKVEAAAPAPYINVKEEVEVKNEPKKICFCRRVSRRNCAEECF